MYGLNGKSANGFAIDKDGYTLVPSPAPTYGTYMVGDKVDHKSTDLGMCDGKIIGIDGAWAWVKWPTYLNPLTYSFDSLVHVKPLAVGDKVCVKDRGPVSGTIIALCGEYAWVNWDKTSPSTCRIKLLARAS